MRRALVVCPGRGSYDRAALGWLKGHPGAAAIVPACDAWRAAQGRVPVSDLDNADAYQAKSHVAGENASLLTFACTMADFAAIDRSRYEIVGVAGNSMGWYTALAAAGALSLSDAIRLVDTMGSYQEGHVIGGQLLYPLSDATGALDPALKDAVTAALRAANAVGYAGVSIDLGNTLVLAGDEAGLKALTEALPKLERGARTFPVRLPLHSAFHTPLLAETAARAQADLADLDFRAPDVTLVDGRGRAFRPRWADPAGLAAYTLGAQVTETYGFARSIQVALHHTGPDVVIALGPGNPLGGPLAWQLVHEGWNGVRDRAAFATRQAGEAPLLLSTGVPEQRARLW